MLKVTARWILEGSVAGLEQASCSPAYSRQQAKGRTQALPENWGTWLPSPTAVDLGGGYVWQQCPGLILTCFSQSLFLVIKTS